MAKVSGTVFRFGGEQRIEYASVKATKKGEKVRYTTTDDDGDFSLDDLAPGTWRLVALHEESFPSKAIEIDLMEDTQDLRIDLQRLQGDEDRRLGRRLFIGLLIALGVLIALYVGLHVAIPRQPAPLSAMLPTLIARAEAQAASAGQIGDSAVLSATVADIKAGFALALDKRTDLEAADREIASALLGTVEAALQANQKDAFTSRLAALREVVETPSKAQFGPWDRDPWRFLEVLFWALAGILVNKIITVGWYVRSQRFYREGMSMHLAHLVSTPLLVLVAVLLLSLVTFDVTLAGGNNLTIDLSEPTIMVAVSFVLGTIPWPLWRFIEDMGKRLSGQMS